MTSSKGKLPFAPRLLGQAVVVRGDLKVLSFKLRLGGWQSSESGQEELGLLRGAQTRITEHPV